MNKVELIGRLTGDPSIRYGTDKNGNQFTAGEYSLAVDRRGSDEADFIRCKVFGKAAEFAEKWLKKGMKIAVVGRIVTASYTDRDGKKIYTTDINIEEQEFCESKKENENRQNDVPAPAADADGFMNVPEGIDEDLPFAGPEKKGGKKK